MSALPPGFLWGTATAAHQVEGGNVNADCWALEQAQPSLFAEPSGDAVDHYHRFRGDIEIAAGIGVNAYRFSIEWARIEPEQGAFSTAALDHYRRCIDACLAHGLAPVVTFHHFTQPRWMARLGGFGAADFPAIFANYCGRAARALDGMALACTINELNLPIMAGTLLSRSLACGRPRGGGTGARGSTVELLSVRRRSRHPRQRPCRARGGARRHPVGSAERCGRHDLGDPRRGGRTRRRGAAR